MELYNKADVMRDRFKCPECKGTGTKSSIQSFNIFTPSVRSSCSVCAGLGTLNFAQALYNRSPYTRFTVLVLAHEGDVVGFRFIVDFGGFYGNKKVFDCEAEKLPDRVVSKLKHIARGVEQLTPHNDRLLTSFEVANSISVDNVSNNHYNVAFICSKSW